MQFYFTGGQPPFFNTYGAFAGTDGNIQVTISRLPYIQQPTGGTQNFNAAGLNNIAPAAGNEEETAEDLAGIEPAAGGDENAEEVSCWGDAANNASGGQASSFSFGNTFGDESIAQAANCNTASAL